MATRKKAVRKPRAPKQADEDAVRELKLYIWNDSRFAPSAPSGIGRLTTANLYRKRLAGKYDRNKAIRGWRYMVEAAAKTYAKEFAMPNEWSRIFTKATREEVQRDCESWFFAAANSGELSGLVGLPQYERV